MSYETNRDSLYRFLMDLAAYHPLQDAPFTPGQLAAKLEGLDPHEVELFTQGNPQYPLCLSARAVLGALLTLKDELAKAVEERDQAQARLEWIADEVAPEHYPEQPPMYRDANGRRLVAAGRWEVAAKVREGLRASRRMPLHGPFSV